jgi:hypothetical protein
LGFFDYLYIFVAVVFAYMTFIIVLRNFQSKFNDKGERLDLIQKDKKQNPKD